MNKEYRNILIVFFALIFITTSCEEENLGADPVVIPEQILFVGGEQVRLAGRLVANQNQPVSEHGFSISTDPSFSSPITISLGVRESPGRFIGETAGLTSGQLYYWKPFTIISGQLIEGETGEFTTLLPEITSFSPLISLSGQFITITGRNFTSDSKVFFDDIEAQVTKIEKETTIQAIIPTLVNSKFAKIKVISQDKVLEAEDSFEYVIGKWEFLDNFFTPYVYSESISFTDGDEFLFGLGYENLDPNGKIWSLNIPAWDWTETSYDKGVLFSAFNGSSFIGGGAIQIRFSEFSDKFFVYENGEFIEKNTLPFLLYKSVSFKIDGEIYVTGGFDPNDNPNYSVFKYIEAEDRWESVSINEIHITSDFPYFAHQSFGYFITPDQVMYRFDPDDLSVNPISFYPSNAVENGYGISEVMGNKVYIGLFKQTRLMWEYDISNNSWKQKTGFSGGTFTETALASFSYDNIIYVFQNPKNNQQDGVNIWTFKPDEF
jgi:hypothetical protein